MTESQSISDPASAGEHLEFFRPVPPSVDFDALEKAVLEFWKQNRTFKCSVDIRSPEKTYRFYDGPPFATGLPHYGHIMTSIIKDVVPRFFTMKGYRVERRFGWDCHGVPVEFELEKELGLGGRTDIEKMGIANFNEACRGIVLRYTREWQQIIERVGRWVDFDNDYKTMDPSYMESVWWVFKTLWDKGLIYRDHKIVHYSWRLSTPYSNFEATLDDAYREREDPSIVVSFPLRADPATVLLAWTTTPWTLPSNMALAVHPDLRYAKVQTDGDLTYVLCADLVEKHFNGVEHTIVSEIAGRELAGLHYIPPFDYFESRAADGAFRVLEADFVSAEDGTGIVHCAPAFGEDDFDLAKREGVPLVDPVDDAGCFTAEAPEFATLNVFDANPRIIEQLKTHGRLFSHEIIVHSYPHDWRTDTPLIYRAIPSWFLRVTSLKEHMLKNNAQINWIPGHVKYGAFGKWLENARDWAISRNRYWGAAIPLWQCESCQAEMVIGSIEELRDASGVEDIDDLHRHFIDHIEIPCAECGGNMHRIPEVLDCWFESGSMPYAQIHYPFEGSDDFDSQFPADFIVEYIGQARGWFYTLLVISTALTDRPPFLNAIAHGILLGDDGRKMSKRLRNYPDIAETVGKYGADAMRLYLVSHPVIDGADSRIEGQGIADMLRRFVLPVWNAFSFFTRYAEIDGWRPDAERTDFQTEFDRWILSRVYALAADVDRALSTYQLRQAVLQLMDFVDDLNNWYIRRSRDRFWQSEHDVNKLAAYQTLYEVLTTLALVAAPLTPFLSEVIFKNLTGRESVHLSDWPESSSDRVDGVLNQRLRLVRRIASLGMAARAKANVKVRQPLAKVSMRIPLPLTESDMDQLRDELNVKSIQRIDDVTEYAILILRPLGDRIGPVFGRDTSAIIRAVKHGDFTRQTDGSVLVRSTEREWELADDMVETHFQPREGFACATDAELVVVLDIRMSDELRREGYARELVRHTQSLRKDADYRLDDRVDIAIVTSAPEVLSAVSAFRQYISDEVLALELKTDITGGWDQKKGISVDGSPVTIAIRLSESRRPVKADG